jgi:hypothetical protein
MGYLLAITHTLTYAEKDVNCAKLVSAIQTVGEGDREGSAR